MSLVLLVSHWVALLEDMKTWGISRTVSSKLELLLVMDKLLLNKSRVGFTHTHTHEIMYIKFETITKKK